MFGTTTRDYVNRAGVRAESLVAQLLSKGWSLQMCPSTAKLAPLESDRYLPAELRSLDDPQTAIPAIAKDKKLLRLIQEAVGDVPTEHELYLADARQ
ncbi:MAG: hypothetical protein ACYSWU_11005, partial [Planctomycetota bacterium]